MAGSFLFWLGILAIAGSMLAAYFSYRVYKYSRLSKSWTAITFALLLTVFVRFLSLSDSFEFLAILNPQTLQVWNVFLFITISALFSWGFYDMKRSFETFDVVEKKTQDKIKRMNK